ncbi:lasso peptide biosynthesis PqqD family chaperone [Fictibacillus fluitans]|uniref:Lasso peptide biosynthesis PqqD family chaperone n=1 Tax=Fictibacillus fluitans TaxID=3058422 RepID=A0ABT8I136_9BACL|nr:lasso peptide biosynthesis PqqD family chaperone [Fictibacillus sp. NE201]MDN4526743.1 lasso peptide biosynthesis PqqD family chaperone [Fictibacillus sp. NE201]
MIKSSTVGLQTKVVQASGNIVSDMGGEKVMLSINNGKYYNLGAIGGVIWEKIKTPVTVNNLIRDMLSEYQIDEDQCKEEILTFLEQLHIEQLVQLS